MLLLPHPFKRIGWMLFIPTALFGLLMAIDGFNGFPSFLLPGSAVAGDIANRISNNVALIGVLLGSLLITCSRERVEDELIARIRLNALLAALYTTTGIAVIAASRALRLHLSLLHDFQSLSVARTLPRDRTNDVVAVEKGGLA